MLCYWRRWLLHSSNSDPRLRKG